MTCDSTQSRSGTLYSGSSKKLQVGRQFWARKVVNVWLMHGRIHHFEALTTCLLALMAIELVRFWSLAYVCELLKGPCTANVPPY